MKIILSNEDAMDAGCMLMHCKQCNIEYIVCEKYDVYNDRIMWHGKWYQLHPDYMLYIGSEDGFCEDCRPIKEYVFNKNKH